jgi:hypothetical protein
MLTSGAVDKAADVVFVRRANLREGSRAVPIKPRCEIRQAQQSKRAWASGVLKRD